MNSFDPCLSCRSFRNGCSGPNPCELDIPEMFAFLEKVRKMLGYSYQYLADRTGIAVNNVKLNLTGQVKNPSFMTVKLLCNELIGDPSGRSPCAFASGKVDCEACKKLEEAQLALEDMTERKQHFKELAEEFRSQSHIKDEQIARKDEQLNHRAHAMMERWQVVERLMKELDELKALNASLVEKNKALKQQLSSN